MSSAIDMEANIPMYIGSLPIVFVKGLHHQQQVDVLFLWCSLKKVFDFDALAIKCNKEVQTTGCAS